MATSKKTATHRAPASTTRRHTSETHRSTEPDAVKLLIADHRAVKALFQEYQTLVDNDGEVDEKEDIAQQICMMLTVHCQVEEEIFYPAARVAIKEADLVDEATVEQAAAKELVAQIEAATPTEPLFDAKVKVLGEMIDHHTHEEETELFVQARKSTMDLRRLGEQMLQRKAELMADMGVEEVGQEAEGARA